MTTTQLAEIRESIKDTEPMPMSSPDPSGSPPSLRRDLHRTREGAFATTAELREFVHHLRGKSPQEVLGAVANSGLAQGVGLASVGTAIVMAVFTVGPYLVYGKPSTPAAKKEAATAAAAPVTDTTAAATAHATDKEAPASKDAASNAQQTLDKMGESETKQADPKVNPLDNLDDLLDTKK